MNLSDKATATIISFQEKIEKWFHGTGAQNANDTAMILNDFHADFKMVSPDGSNKSLHALATWLPVAYGAKPGIVIAIKEINVCFEQAGMVLMEFQEYQHYAGTTYKRKSSALFLAGEDGMAKWRYLHETSMQ